MVEQHIDDYELVRPSIQALSSAVLEDAKAFFQWKSVCHAITFSAVVLSICSSGIWLYLLALTAAVSEIGAWVMGFIAEPKKQLGHDLIRLNILQNAYRQNFSHELVYLKNLVSDSVLRKALKFETDDYYSTTAILGDERLRDIVQESCFWTQHLYWTCMKYAVAHAATLLALVVVLVFSLFPLLGTGNDFAVLRVALLFLVSFPLLDSISKAVAWGTSSHRMRLIDDQLGNSPLSSATVFSLFATYAVVASNSPLVPDRRFNAKRAFLNALWKERQENQEGEHHKWNCS